MTGLRIGAFLHVVGVVFLVGYALFWVVVSAALGREEPEDSARLLGVAASSRWPPAALPWRLRLPLPVVGWAILGVVTLTGAYISSFYGVGASDLFFGGTPWGSAMTLKMVCFVVLLAGQVGMTIRPSPPLAYLNGVATILTLFFAALLRH